MIACFRCFIGNEVSSFVPDNTKISAWTAPFLDISDILLRVSSVSPSDKDGRNAEGITIAGSIIHDPLTLSFCRDKQTKLEGLISGRALERGWMVLDLS